ncbi:hypothetical protein SDC9_106310 [bioreactor metagenome]|uniref:Uncharacterized protein n=1 Tax=bioreactor metagenome TaxID=1076179 RepID=A0A645B317_9ZZZZ
MHPVRGHAVGAFDRAQRDHIIVGAVVAHHPDRADRQEDREGLPDRIVQSGFLDFLDHDGVGFAQDVERRLGHRADVTDRQPRTRERLAHHYILGQAELASDFAHFVLEQVVQGFEQFEFQVLGQSAHIVVAFDQRRGIARDRHRLDHVGIGGALGEESGVLDRLGGVGEDAHEFGADDLALGFGIAHAGELVEEAVGGVDVDQLHVEVVAEELLHPVRLVFAQQPVVHENAGQPVADGLVDQRRRDARIDAAGKAEDHPFFPDPGADFAHRAFDIGLHGPVAGTAADTVAEVGQNGFAVGRMHHFGMELDAVELALCDRDRAEFGVAGGRQHFEGGVRRGGHFVAVRHPDLNFPGQSGEKLAAVAGDPEHGFAIFARGAGLNLAAEREGHDLEPVTDAEHWNAELENGRIALRRVGVVDAGGAAGENDALRIDRLDLFRGGEIRQNLAVDMTLADTAGNQLAVLRTEVQHDDAFGCK